MSFYSTVKQTLLETGCLSVNGLEGCVCVCVLVSVFFSGGDGGFESLELIYQGIHVFSMTEKPVEFMSMQQVMSFRGATIPTHPLLLSPWLWCIIYKHTVLMGY